jgi:hypothetical protein
LLRRQENGLVYYQFESLLRYDCITHGVFTRLGGVSRGPFATLNLGKSVGDVPQAVDENYSRITRALGTTQESLVTGYQQHTDHVVAVGETDVGRLLPATDGLATGSTRVTLTLRFADCVPLLFLDPVRLVVAIAHAGWKGTVSKIGRRTLEVMKSEFGSRPSDVIACIGPSIGPCCYPIGEDVAVQVHDAFPDAGDLLLRQPDGSVHFDLWAANRRVLEEVGVTAIESAALCTACHCDEFYSHRREKGATGRFGAFVRLVADSHRLKVE